MLALTFLIYSNTAQAPFILDDLPHIKGNPHIHLSELSVEGIIRAVVKSPARRRPVANISFALNYYFHEQNVLGYHLVNILIHIATGILLYLFVKTTLIELKSKRPMVKAEVHECDQSTISDPAFIAFFAALIWLVHPIQTQSVTYIVQRMNSMSAMFYILSMLLYVKGRIAQKQTKAESFPEKCAPPHRNWCHIPPGKFFTGQVGSYGPPASRKHIPATSYFFPIHSTLCYTGSFFAGIMALGSKEIAATLPFFIILYELYFIQDLSWAWLKRYFFLFACILTAFTGCMFLCAGEQVVEAISSTYGIVDFTVIQRLLTESRVVILYLSLLAFPHPSRLNLDHDFSISTSLIDPVTVLISIMAIIGLVVIAIYLANRERLFSFCIFWFLGNLAIESSIIGIEIIYEHRLYLPSMFVSLGLVILACRCFRLKWLIATSLCGVVAVCSIWTYTRNDTWRSGVTLWQDSVSKSPEHIRPRFNLGNALLRHERAQEAVLEYNKALSMRPNFQRIHYGLGNALVALGRTNEAIHHYKEALRIDPYYAAAHQSIGVALSNDNRLDEAIIHYKKALSISPYCEECHNNLGTAMFTQGKLDKAIEHYTKALQIDPGSVSVHKNLGLVLVCKGRLDRAIDHFQIAVQMKPNDIRAQSDLRNALAIQKRIKDAVEGMHKALMIDPHVMAFNQNLETLIKKRSDLDKALAQYQRALSMQSGCFEVKLKDLDVVNSVVEEYNKRLFLLKKGMSLHSHDADIFYIKACIYARQNRIDKAVDWFIKAVNAGFNNWDDFSNNDNLRNILEASKTDKLINAI